MKPTWPLSYRSIALIGVAECVSHTHTHTHTDCAPLSLHPTHFLKISLERDRVYVCAISSTGNWSMLTTPMIKIEPTEDSIINHVAKK